MKILITGGKGFIGSKIVEILSQDHSITIVDNHDTYGLLDKQELQKLFEWRQMNWNKENVSFVYGDILDRGTCLKAFSYHPDIVIHLATYPRAKIVENALHKPSKKFGLAYTCYNAPKKIPKDFIGENNNNFIGKFCHVGGENFYKEKQSDIELGGKFQWGGGQCSEGCNYNNNSICKNNICNDEYPFPYYYYNKFLKSLGIIEKNKQKMESKALKISKDICKGVYN